MQVSPGSTTSARLTRLQATTRALTQRYLLALSLIAALALGGFLTLLTTIESREASSSIINTSARQSTLAQDIAATTRHLVGTRDPSARAVDRGKLFEDAHAIEEAHRRLTDPDDPLGRPVKTSERIRALYFDDPLNLDRQIRTFVEHALRLSGVRDREISPWHPSVRYILAATSGGLLISLDALVDRLEADATANVRRSRRLEIALLIATLLMLSLEALFIFRPIVRRVWQEGVKLIESQDRLVELAHYDSLTNLPNRALFQIRLEMALAQARRDRQFAAVLQLDLDHFKDVNDTLGHAAGDHLLCTIARRLQGALRETDTVARLGGDEFVVIITGLRSIEQVGRLAESLVAVVSEPVAYLETTLHTTTSVGITVYPHDDEEPEQLLKNADIALYQAKERGRNTYSFFIGEMKERIAHRKRLEGELRRALARDELEVFYQPQIQLQDGRIVSVEALVRWRHPGFGLLLPGAFIGLAEESGLIVPLGELVLRRALAQMRRWSDQGVAPERVAVNLSAVQFRRGDVARVVQDALNSSGLEAERLELEVAEGVILSRSQNEVGDAMERLHALGVSFSLDDFGTGYASLTHLNRFSFQRLKIDRSFVRDIEHDPGDAVIVRTVINLGHSLGYEVIAEGVENEEQLAYLRLHGCELAQGFLLGVPMAGEALTEQLLEGGRVELPCAGRS
ncbi:MAG: putative bifunctional diguanylate cyclase/phosphodiesterase, partial [Geminicoccales bacterium]